MSQYEDEDENCMLGPRDEKKGKLGDMIYDSTYYDMYESTHDELYKHNIDT
jgi:hypothetical protein